MTWGRSGLDPDAIRVEFPWRRLPSQGNPMTGVGGQSSTEFPTSGEWSSGALKHAAPGPTALGLACLPCDFARPAEDDRDRRQRSFIEPWGRMSGRLPRLALVPGCNAVQPAENIPPPLPGGSAGRKPLADIEQIVRSPGPPRPRPSKNQRAPGFDSPSATPR